VEPGRAILDTLRDSPIRVWPLDDRAAPSSNARELVIGTPGTYTNATGSQRGLLAGFRQSADFAVGSSGYVNCGTVDVGGTVVGLRAIIRPRTFQASAPNINSIAGVENAGDTADHFLRVTSGVIEYVLARSGGLIVLAGSTLVVGKTYDVVGTYDGTTTRLYLNGVQVASSTAFTGTVAGNLNFDISRIAPYGRYFDGRIGLVAAYVGTIPSADRVRSLYRSARRGLTVA
jgi:hypothetical protein